MSMESGGLPWVSMIDIIGMSFIPVCTFLVFVSLLLMVWGGFRLVITVCLHVVIITRYQWCVVWAFAFLRTFFRLAVYLFDWIDKVMEDMGKRVSTYASHDWTVEGCVD
jgi:hypothetical protein